MQDRGRARSPTPAVVNPRIRVHGEIETGIRQVVFLFADKRSPRPEIEPRAAIKYLRINKNLDIPIERFALDGNLLDIIEVRKEVLQVRRRTKIVDEIRLDGIENRDILDLVRMFDVLFKDLMNNTFDIGALFILALILQRFGKASKGQVLGKLSHEKVIDGLAEKTLHIDIFRKIEWEHLELDIATVSFVTSCPESRYEFEPVMKMDQPPSVR